MLFHLSAANLINPSVEVLDQLNPIMDQTGRGKQFMGALG